MTELLDVGSKLVPTGLRLFLGRGASVPEGTNGGFRPSVVPLGSIRLSVRDGLGRLWAAVGGGLVCFSQSGESAEARSELAGGREVLGLALENGSLFAATADGVYKTDIGCDEAKPAAGAPRQKLVAYFAASDGRVPSDVRSALAKAITYAPTALTNAIGGVAASAPDGEGGRFLAVGGGVMQLRADGTYEVYAGPRYIYGLDEEPVSVCSDGEAGLWISSEAGYTHISRPFVSLEDKARHYRAMAEQLHTARGSVCDVHYTTKDAGNSGLFELRERYSTNNDALWAVFDGISEAYDYARFKREGDDVRAADAARRLTRITENVMLQAHISGRGNGFIARGYVSRRDRCFIKEGKLATGGLWFAKGGAAPDGSPAATVEETDLAHFKSSAEDGRNFSLSESVRGALKTDARYVIDGGFRLWSPDGAEIPPRLARLYREADPWRPEYFPASRDQDIIYKADTSSEEAIAAFCMYYFAWKYYLSEGNDPGLLGLVRATAALTLTHILDNGFCLRDAHGNPTQWGKWFAGYFVNQFAGVDEAERDYGAPWHHPDYAFCDGPLNSAEYLCFIRTSMELFRGAAGYEALYERVCGLWELAFDEPDGVTDGKGYAKIAGEYQSRLTELARNEAGRIGWALEHGKVPEAERAAAEKRMANCREAWADRDYTLCINHSDETLALISYIPLIEMESGEKREWFRSCFEQWLDNMAREGTPMYVIAAAALCPDGGYGAAVPAAAEYLYRYPYFLRAMPAASSGRNDVYITRAQENGEANINRVLPPDEAPLHKCNANPYIADTYRRGARSSDPTERAKYGGGFDYDSGYMYSGNIFTIPYSMAKYYGII